MSVLFRVTGTSIEEWEGPFEALIKQNPELPPFVERRLRSLAVGETVRPPIGDDTFEITRTK
jgi:hypothetical protein